MCKTGMLPTWPLVLVVAALLVNPAPFNADSHWIEKRSAHYAIFYQAGFEKDAEFTGKWLDYAEQVMKAKWAMGVNV